MIPWGIEYMSFCQPPSGPEGRVLMLVTLLVATFSAALLFSTAPHEEPRWEPTRTSH